MEKKDNLFQYLRSELGWSARTSRSWIHLLLEDRRTAMQRLRQGAVSPEYRKRASRWYAATTITFRKMRLTAPMLVGASTCLYFILGKTSLISSLAYGLTAGFVTHVVLMVLPFALLASVPLLGFFLLRALFGVNIPEPVTHEPQVTAEFRAAAERQKDAPEILATDGSQAGQVNQSTRENDLLAEANRLSPNHVMASKFDGSDQPFLLRLLEYDGSVVVRDPADLEIISKWIGLVRKAQAEMATLHKAVGRLARLDTVVTHRHTALFELGLLDRASYRSTPTPPQNQGEFERLEAGRRELEDIFRRGSANALGNTHQDVFGDGSTSAEFLDEDGEPIPPPGKDVKLISPRGHGYIFMTRVELFGQEPPLLTCSAVRDIVAGYVEATSDHEMMRAFQQLQNVGSDPQAYFQARNSSRGINLEHIENQLLAREVRDTAAQRLANCYAQCLAAIEEYRDIIAHQQMVASLVRLVLDKAHKAVVVADARERAARIAARKNSISNPYRDASSSRMRLKTEEQRRAELKAYVEAAIPTAPLERKGR